jgi:hypothetical protein
LGFVAHADQRQFFLKTFSDTNNHVVYQLAHGASHGISFARFIGRLKLQRASIICHLHQAIQCQLQNTTSALNTDLVFFNGHVNTCGDVNWQFTYTGHL